MKLSGEYHRILKVIKIGFHMSFNLNKATIIGNVGREPDVRTTQQEGKEIIHFSVATRIR